MMSVSNQARYRKNIPIAIFGTAVTIARALAGLVILLAAEPIIRDNKLATGLYLVTLSIFGLTSAVTVA